MISLIGTEQKSESGTLQIGERNCRIVWSAPDTILTIPSPPMMAYGMSTT